MSSDLDVSDMGADGVSDMPQSDMPEDMFPDLPPTCSDSIQNGRESDVDCGGQICERCEDNLECFIDDDCQSDYCRDGVCRPKLPTGSPCEEDEGCIGGECRNLNGQGVCTQPCDDQNMCPGGFSCFSRICVPNDYCNDPDGDGYGDGPGCIGTECDQCSENANCEQLISGRYQCTCAPGFEGNGVTCNDINECAIGQAGCDSNATCTNTAPGFQCACNPGYTGDGLMCADVDECASGNNNCSVNATCANTPGGFSCMCLPGFVGDGTRCMDADDCVGNPCGPGGVCTDVVGGYTCQCNSGYVLNGQTCVNVNECLNNPCAANATCTDSEGSFGCTCDAGYVGDGFTCMFLGDCTTDPGLCVANASCVAAGSNNICECDMGYTGNGFAACADIDECANDPNLCGANSVCTNTPGSYTCACAPGAVDVGGSCVFPGDECGAAFPVTSMPFFGAGNTASANLTYEVPPNACPGVFGARGSQSGDQAWIFTPAQTGTYNISVAANGWNAVAFVVSDCGDVANSCLAGDSFNPDFEVDLQSGVTYYIIVDGASNFSVQEGSYQISIELNECDSGLDNCDANATCTDFPTGFTCTCDAGFVGDGVTCTDIDECVINADNCDANATCSNTTGGFDCTCNFPFNGDGVDCWDPAASGETCQNPTSLGMAAPASTMVNTGNFHDDFSVSQGSCQGTFGGDGAPDQVFSFTPTTSGTYTFSTSQATFSHTIRVLSDCNGNCLEGDFGGSFNGASLNVNLTAGTTYYIIVDGLGSFGNNDGQLVLSVN